MSDDLTGQMPHRQEGGPLGADKIANRIPCVIGLGFLLLSAFATCGKALAFSPDRVLLVNATIIDSTGGPAMDNGYLLADGGIIVDMGPGMPGPVPGATRIQAHGLYLLPGIIDAHNHVLPDPDQEQVYLMQGVTTLGGAGTPLTFLTGNSEEAGCRRVQCGPVIAAPGGYPVSLHGPGNAMEVSGIREARAAVRRLQEAGAEVVKVALEPGPDDADWPLLDAEVLAAVVDEAHGLGLQVRAHVEQGEYLAMALAAGVDTIDHLPLFGNVAAMDEAAASLVRSGVVLVPTLEAGCRSTWDNRPLLDLAGRVHRLGGRIALGTDAPFKGVEPGLPFSEMDLLLQAGLSPAEIVVAATVHAAAALGKEGSLGTLEPGKAADCILVRDDPRTDLAALRKVALVMRGGEVVFNGLLPAHTCETRSP